MKFKQSLPWIRTNFLSVVVFTVPDALPLELRLPIAYDTMNKFWYKALRIAFLDPWIGFPNAHEICRLSFSGG